MRCGVERILFDGDRAIGVRLPHGEEVAADVIFSCAGYPETMKLCGFGNAREADEEIGRLSFVESVAVLDQPAARLGWESTILFYNDAETFTYARPDEPADLRSGILCCPGNYEAHEDEPEEMVRLTWLADYDRWAGLSENEYRAQKDAYRERFLTAAERFIPALRSHVVATDLFTPRTIERYTGRMRGAVYGSPRKHREGRTPFRRLYVCGTDQGYLGIIGAMLSGVTMANKHVLAEE
jgi:phytoene dehydrogenase-like protein